MKEFTLDDVLIFILENLKSGKPEEKEFIDAIKEAKALDNMLQDVVD